MRDKFLAVVEEYRIWDCAQFRRFVWFHPLDGPSYLVVVGGSELPCGRWIPSRLWHCGGGRFAGEERLPEDFALGFIVHDLPGQSCSLVLRLQRRYSCLSTI